MRTKQYTLFILVFLRLTFFSQNGDCFVRNYLPKDYKQPANNFGVTQDLNGLIYVANDNGVLIFDGSTWDICQDTLQPSIFAIQLTKSGEIVVGTSDGDVARIEKKKNGKFSYFSLLKFVSVEDQPAEPIRQILVNGSLTYFLSSDKLIEYDGRICRSISPKSSFHTRAFVLGKHLFVVEAGSHISVLINGKLIKVEGTEELANDKCFFNYPLPTGRYAIGFRKSGIHYANYMPLQPEKTRFTFAGSNADELLGQSEVNNGCALTNGNYIVTTNKLGAFELDTSLRIVKVYNTNTGIPDENVKYAFEDKAGNLWLATYYGISLLEINSKLFQYSRANGIAGLIESAAYFNKVLFIASDKGVQYYDTVNSRFVTANGFNKQSWYLSVIRDNLFVGTAAGLFLYEKKEFKQISESNTFRILKDPERPGLFYVGTDEGIEVYTFGWNQTRMVTSYHVGSPVKSMDFDERHNLFFPGSGKRIYFLNHAKGYTLDSIIETGDLPEQESANYVFQYNGRILLGTYEGIYSIVDSSGKYKIQKDPTFWSPTKEAIVYGAIQNGENIICSQRFMDHEKNIMVDKVTILEPGRTKVNSYMVNHLNEARPNTIVLDKERGTVIISANEGVFFLKENPGKNKKLYSLLLKGLYNGNEALLENWFGKSSIDEELTVPYANNNVTAMFGFTSYETNSLEFSYMLEGNESEYSEWTHDNRYFSRNLREGSYVLKVKARTEAEDKVYTIDVPFRITPPWYRSWAAYIVYLILFIAFVWLVARLNAKRLIAQNKKLEQTIEERTHTIVEQKEEIEHKQKEILDSINYAQRIQRALLASDQLLKKNLPPHFVFFRPKDVVSGDFYWAAELSDGRFALVTADSTGHGVPGAIMSMLNISCLTDAVEAKQLTEPHEILNATRSRVINYLANDGSATGGKDGMDCSLICFDFKNNRMSFAAANNPVWVVRKQEGQDSEFIELLPDKMPVGKHDRDDQSFSNNIFDLKKGDMVYALTDGLPDQFGGPKGKKFMYKQLKVLLQEIATFPEEVQRAALEKAMDEWQGKQEQVDDVTLIGVRIT